jgi:hypothetical protein
MLGGDAESAVSRDHARELLAAAEQTPAAAKPSGRKSASKSAAGPDRT